MILQCDNLDALESCNWQVLKSKGYALNASLKHIKGHTQNTTKRTKVHNTCDQLAGERMRAYRRKLLQA
ncbi:hypothetical protein [Vibrio sp. 10N.239.312.D08]|uniref:hypothetical protein n=1 Tax=Vibrio sp. 10N.239.312.D08 TaxID=3229978 RepID=UPI0035546226